jgi:hypothetical protein
MAMVVVGGGGGHAVLLMCGHLTGADLWGVYSLSGRKWGVIVLIIRYGERYRAEVCPFSCKLEKY